jgi:hypothetical protein
MGREVPLLDSSGNPREDLNATFTYSTKTNLDNTVTLQQPNADGSGFEDTAYIMPTQGLQAPATVGDAVGGGGNYAPTGAAPYNPLWTYEMNTSYYYPSLEDPQFGEGAVLTQTDSSGNKKINRLIVGDETNSFPKGSPLIWGGGNNPVAFPSPTQLVTSPGGIFNEAPSVESFRGTLIRDATFVSAVDTANDPGFATTFDGNPQIGRCVFGSLLQGQTSGQPGVLGASMGSNPYTVNLQNVFNKYTNQGKDYHKPFSWMQDRLDEITFDNSMELQKEFLQNNPGENPKARYCDEVGHAMIDKIELVIGGTLIDSHPGHYLHVWNELTQTPEKKQIGHLVGRSGSEAELEDMAMDEQDLYIPLQFFFCRHLMCSLPLIALQYHQVEVKVTFKQITEVVAFPGYQYLQENGTIRQPPAANISLGHTASWYQHMITTNRDYVNVRPKASLQNNPAYHLSANGVKLLCNLVYLEEEERKTFAGSTHEYLVDLLQFQGPQTCEGTKTTYHAYFNHPTSELIWTFVPRVAIRNGEPFNYTALQSSYNSAGDTMKTAKLQFNGYDRFAAMPATYFREIVPAQYHTSVPTRPVYVYSFALEPEDFRPSGSVNLSRIDNVKLVTEHVDFKPQIVVQPYIGTDAVNDIFW